MCKRIAGCDLVTAVIRLGHQGYVMVTLQVYGGAAGGAEAVGTTLRQ
jgi:hypothetical protein